MDAGRYTQRLQNECSEKAQAILGSTGSAQKEIAALLETICSSPAASSRPGEYIEAHPQEYQRLLEYGGEALRYLFREFLNGGQTDLRGQVMRIAMDDLIGGEALRLYAATGQEYFDAWLENAKRTQSQEGDEAMEQYHPNAWLLLQMEQQSYS